MKAILAEIMFQRFDTRGHMYGAALGRNGLLRDKVEGGCPYSERPAQGLWRQRKILHLRQTSKQNAGVRPAAVQDFQQSFQAPPPVAYAAEPRDIIDTDRDQDQVHRIIVSQPSHPIDQFLNGVAAGALYAPMHAPVSAFGNRGCELHRQRGFNAPRADTINDGVANGQKTIVLSLTDSPLACARGAGKSQCARSEPEPLQGSQWEQCPKHQMAQRRAQ